MNAFSGITSTCVFSSLEQSSLVQMRSRDTRIHGITRLIRQTRSPYGSGRVLVSVVLRRYCSELEGVVVVVVVVVDFRRSKCGSGNVRRSGRGVLNDVFITVAIVVRYRLGECGSGNASSCGVVWQRTSR